MDAAEGDFLAGDHDHAAVGGPALDPDRFDLGPGWGSGGTGAVEPGRLVVGEGAGSGAEELSGLGVEEDHALAVDADRDPAPAEDLRGEHDPAAEPNGSAGGYDPVDLDAAPSPSGAIGGGPGGRRWRPGAPGRRWTDGSGPT